MTSRATILVPLAVLALVAAALPAQAEDASTASYTRVVLSPDGRASFLVGQAWIGAAASEQRREIDRAAGNGDSVVSRAEATAFARARAGELAGDGFARLLLDGRAPEVTATVVNVTGGSNVPAASEDPLVIATSFRLSFESALEGKRVNVTVIPLSDGSVDVAAPREWRFEDGNATIAVVGKAGEPSFFTIEPAKRANPPSPPTNPTLPSRNATPEESSPEGGAFTPTPGALAAVALALVAAAIVARRSREGPP